MIVNVCGALEKSENIWEHVKRAWVPLGEPEGVRLKLRWEHWVHVSRLTSGFRNVSGKEWSLLFPSSLFTLSSSKFSYFLAMPPAHLTRVLLPSQWAFAFTLFWFCALSLFWSSWAHCSPVVRLGSITPLVWLKNFNDPIIAFRKVHPNSLTSFPNAFLIVHLNLSPLPLLIHPHSTPSPLLCPPSWGRTCSFSARNLFSSNPLRPVPFPG